MTDTARGHLERAIELLDALELPSVRRDYATVEIRHALELLAIPPREPTEDQRDAQRYRWLCAWPADKQAYGVYEIAFNAFNAGRPKDEIDFAIDAAIAKREGK